MDNYIPMVLVVSPDPALRRRVARALTGEPYRVVSAESPERAHQCFARDCAPDAVVWDCVFPEAEFIDFARKFPTTVRIALTSGGLEFNSQVRVLAVASSALAHEQLRPYVSMACERAQDIQFDVAHGGLS